MPRDGEEYHAALDVFADDGSYPEPDERLTAEVDRLLKETRMVSQEELRRVDER